MVSRFLFFVFIIITIEFELVFGQTDNSNKIFPKTEKFQITDKCYFLLKWDSMKMVDKKIENIINYSIKSEIYNYLIADNYKQELICDNNLNSTYSFNCNIVFANNKVISLYLNSNADYDNGNQGDFKFKTINYSVLTGDKINFNDLINDVYKSQIDSMIIHKMNDRMKDYGDEFKFSDQDIQYWNKQLMDLDFNLTSNGINVIMKNHRSGYNANSWMQEIKLNYEEIQDILVDSDLLK